MLRPVSIHALSSGRIDGFRAEVPLDPFAERLGRYVDAGEQYEAGGRPGRRAALEHRYLCAADRLEIRRKLVCSPLPVIRADDPDAKPGQQGAGADFASRQGARHRPEQVTGAELPLLPRIEQREFVPVGDPPAQGVCIDPVHLGGR